MKIGHKESKLLLFIKKSIGYKSIQKAQDRHKGVKNKDDNIYLLFASDSETKRIFKQLQRKNFLTVLANNQCAINPDQQNRILEYCYNKL